MGDALRLGEFLVNPQEIETYIQQHPDIEDCQIIGIDGFRGTRPIGLVVMQETATTSETDLINHCRVGIAKFKVPTHMFWSTNSQPLPDLVALEFNAPNYVR